MMMSASTFAADSKSKNSVTNKPEEDSFGQSAFQEYGSFNEEEEEAETIDFFQRGRFFGASAAFGFQGTTGNRGVLWQGGFPDIDLRLHYWFNFNVALDLGGYYASHFYSSTAGKRIDVSMLSIQGSVKYYFDTRNLSAPLTFASPYLLAGFGSYTKIETLSTDASQVSESTVGFNVGAGLEFVIKPKTVYFSIENRWHFLRFSDTGSQAYEASLGLVDLTGFFWTLTGGIVFTW
jgi:hypothetical protein